MVVLSSSELVCYLSSSLNMLFSLGLIFSAAVSFVHAFPSPMKRSLPSGVVTCGSNSYTASAITNAIDAGVDDMDEGDYPGKSVD